MINFTQMAMEQTCLARFLFLICQTIPAITLHKIIRRFTAFIGSNLTEDYLDFTALSSSVLDKTFSNLKGALKICRQLKVTTKVHCRLLFSKLSYLKKYLSHGQKISAVQEMKDKQKYGEKQFQRCCKKIISQDVLFFLKKKHVMIKQTKISSELMSHIKNIYSFT